jgi:two-component system nitrogen regulation response regulator GlnG/two-component system response regulator HydG
LINDHGETATFSTTPEVAGQPGAEACLHLVLVWSRHESQRLGESSALTRDAILGRGSDSQPGDPPKLEFARARPGSTLPTGSLGAPTLSRRQWRLSTKESAIEIENLGRRDLLHNGAGAKSCTARPGDTVAIDGVATFLVTKRPRVLPEHAFEDFAFGDADKHRMVGEAPELWRVRRELELLAASHGHTLILGDSGTGKELCAQAIHDSSARKGVPLVSRNAATIPQSLVEAELFGNAANYPNAGMPARLGLFGLAGNGTLFLDEIGELEQRQQANLLRALDGGEYQRLGEDRIRRVDVRVIAATNRAPEELKPDVLARFPERLLLPDLNARRSDIPLLVRAILRLDTLKRTSRKTDADARQPSQALIDALVRHDYSSHYRELERLLRLSMKHETMGVLPLTEELHGELKLPINEAALTPEQVKLALSETRNASDAARRLGLPNRYALYRLVKRLGIDQP